MPCPYNGSLGFPGEGVHKLHILGVAVADFVMTIVLAIIIVYLLGSFGVVSRSIVNVVYTFFILWAIAIAMHYYFCVNTTVTVFLFGKR